MAGSRRLSRTAQVEAFYFFFTFFSHSLHPFALLLGGIRLSVASPTHGDTGLSHPSPLDGRLGAGQETLETLEYQAQSLQSH